jgi:hypothetical protein
MIGPLLFLLQQGPDSHYAGGASSHTAGTTAQAGQLFRFLFTTVPQWVQLAGIFIGVPLAIIVVWQMWKHRRALWAWWVSRRRAVQAVIVTAVLVVGVSVIGSGLYGYNYVMHENDFCQACHVMDTAWNRFQVSAHKDIQCHGCHRQPMYVSTVELFWWVTERRMAIPPHDKVPSAVCRECHMRQGTDSARTLVTLTAGHSVHLTSDSSALKNVECVTCHGRDFHKFTPNNASCAQSGCHAVMRVSLGAMTNRSFPHCTSCHDFRSLVKPGVSVTQAKLGLVPNSLNCLKCHTMTDKIRRFDLASDPHKGNCGMCHDAHKQTEPKDAFKTCASAGCHANADTLTAFHRGLGKHAIDQCGACHQAHSWKVRGNNCIACHPTINQDRPAARRVTLAPKSPTSRHLASRTTGPRQIVHFASLTAAPAFVFQPALPTPVAFASRALPVRAADSTFRHSRHTSVGCTDCHSTTDTHGGLKFSRPEGCMACHHSAQQRTSCTTCHATKSLGQHTIPVSFAISARRDPVTRPLAFAHARHGSLACVRCHANGVKRPVTTTCASCHADHHGATANCAGCHPTARTGHDRASHAGCAGCHTDAKVATLSATAPVCLACHQEQRNHYPTGDCATCHAIDHGILGATRAGNGR